MVLLVHHPVSPFSRKVRLILSEKKMLFVLKEEYPWDLSDDALKLNPAGSLPIFVFDGKVIAGNYAISEFLEEANPDEPLFPKDIQKRAETRRLVEWFDDKFYHEVFVPIVSEKIYTMAVQTQGARKQIIYKPGDCLRLTIQNSENAVKMVTYQNLAKSENFYTINIPHSLSAMTE